MKFEYIGHACICCHAENGKKLVLDPPAESYGYILPDTDADYVSCSHGHGDHAAAELFPAPARLPQEGLHLKAGPFTLDRFPCWHDDQNGRLRGPNLVQKVTADGITLVHLGDLGHMPDDALRKFASGADLLAVPVGGVFMLEPEQMLQVVDALHPRYVLPIHYRCDQSSLQQLRTLEDFLSMWKGSVLRLECPEFTLPTEHPEEPVVIVADYSSRNHGSLPDRREI